MVGNTSVSPQSITNLQPASTQCDVDPVCPHRVLPTFNLPQPSVMLIQCVPTELLPTFNLPQHHTVMLRQCVTTEYGNTLWGHTGSTSHCDVEAVCPHRVWQYSVGTLWINITLG